jgi:DtxR family Mn-dependent transcriptional regulator
MSESEEMYLNTIARLDEDGDGGRIPLSALAQALGVQPVSVNQMVRKLGEAGLVDYAPYKGVQLTADGETVAARVLRARRLWQVFLTEHLQLSPGDANTLACRLEHVTPAHVVDRLDGYLDEPAVSPFGKPIPRHTNRADAGYAAPGCAPLTSVLIGESADVTRIDADAPALSFLRAHGLQAGVRVRVAAIGDDGSLLLAVAEGSNGDIAPTGGLVQIESGLARVITVTGAKE